MPAQTFIDLLQSIATICVGIGLIIHVIGSHR